MKIKKPFLATVLIAVSISICIFDNPRAQQTMVLKERKYHVAFQGHLVEARLVQLGQNLTVNEAKLKLQNQGFVPLGKNYLFAFLEAFPGEPLNRYIAITDCDGAYRWYLGFETILEEYGRTRRVAKAMKKPCNSLVGNQAWYLVVKVG